MTTFIGAITHAPQPLQYFCTELPHRQTILCVGTDEFLEAKRCSLFSFIKSNLRDYRHF